MARLHRAVMEQLVDDIASGMVAEGERLPREVDLAQRFGVSRGVVRECLRALEERGLVAVRHGRGAAVVSQSDWDCLDVQILTRLLLGPDRDRYLHDALEVRRLIEGEAAAGAAERAGAATRQHLWTACVRATAVVDLPLEGLGAADLFEQADLAFHRAVVRASGNAMLWRVVEPVHRAFAAVAPPPSPVERGGLQDEHQRIVTAIDAQDAAAARAAVHAHLDHCGAVVAAAERRFQRPTPDER